MTDQHTPERDAPYFCGLHDAGVLGARCECPEPNDPINPSREDVRAYLDGEHGPPHPEAVRIIQDALERDVRRVFPPGKNGAA